ncbi:MAG TPA: sigma-70 family RNA polymerase sigma factor, partial [Cytophagales bacterium]|nr:sigma-70 family RNA polymerase sigma factor [Cytophagales bacterium]
FLSKLMNIEEHQIPELIQSGNDKLVIPLLYDRVLPVVQKFVVRNQGSKDDAFDAFQDALLSFYKQVVKGTYDPKYRVYGYVYRLSINFWLNKIKKDRKIVYDTDFNEADLMDESHIPEKMVFVNTEEENILQRYFSQIGDKCIELLTYTIYQNLLMEDIIIRMGMPSIDSCKMQVMRCKKKLVQMLESNPALLEKLRSK